MSPASSIWAGFKPYIIQRPTRLFIIVSHRGSIECGFVGAFSGAEVRALYLDKVVESERRVPIEDEKIGADSLCCRRNADRSFMVSGGVVRYNLTWRNSQVLSDESSGHCSGRTPRKCGFCRSSIRIDLHIWILPQINHGIHCGFKGLLTRVRSYLAKTSRRI